MPKQTTEKAAFIQQHRGKSYQDIIEAGSAKGISLSKSYIHKVLTDPPGPVVEKRRPGRPAGSGTKTGHPQLAEFRKLVYRVGTDTARSWLEALDQAPIHI